MRSIHILMIAAITLTAQPSPSQDIKPPKMIAPENTLSLTPEQFDLRDPRVNVTGWACGRDITEGAAGLLAELARRRANLTVLLQAAQSMERNPAIVKVPDRDARLRNFDDAINRLISQAPPPVYGLSRAQEKSLAALPENHTRLFGLQPHEDRTVRFEKAGVNDEGTTREFMRPDCFEMVKVIALSNRLRSAAKEVTGLRDKIRQVRDRIGNGGV